MIPGHVAIYLQAEECSEPCQTLKMEDFVKMDNGFKPLSFFAKHYIFDVLLRVVNTFLDVCTWMCVYDYICML